jgi:pimeloyl-ACP methyl ester carboxylesterase
MGLDNMKPRTKFLCSLPLVTAGLGCATLLVVRHTAQLQVQTEIGEDRYNAPLTIQHQHQTMLSRQADLLAMVGRIRGGDASTIQDSTLGSRLSAGDDKKSAATHSGFVTTSDGVKIHYLEAGKAKIVGTVQASDSPLPDAVVTRGSVSLGKQRKVPAILFVPGWTMPAWIWQKQIDYFSSDHLVVAMDPRSQGESSKQEKGAFPATRARDIKAVVDRLRLTPVVIVAWSLAVTEVASYVDQFGTSSLAGIVLVDGVAGGIPPESLQGFIASLAETRTHPEKKREEFVRSMFYKPQSEEYMQRLIKASLATPPDYALALVVVELKADNRPALARIDRPTLIVTAKKILLQHCLRRCSREFQDRDGKRSTTPVTRSSSTIRRNSTGSWKISY